MKVKIEKLDHFGRGICHIDGKICFVDKALPGEEVKIKIVNNLKKYLVGKVSDYYVLSDERVTEECRYSDICGGCNLSHIKMSMENKYKNLKVKELLKKFGNVSEDKILDLVSINEYFYRNKVTLHGSKNVLGYCENGSNSVFGIEECLLAKEKINRVIELLKEMSNNELIEEAMIRTNNECDEVMVALTGKIDDYSILVNFVDTLIVNDEVILGEGKIISSIGNKKYYVSSKSFFQVNGDVTVKLYDEVLNIVKKYKPKKLLDLYCGTGTIGIYVSDEADEVIGVDCSKSSIADAKDNIKLNNVSNYKAICDKVENVINEFDCVDMIVVDPPRAGLDSKTIENIIRIGAETVVYISCDPATLGRDLKLLSKNYNVEYVRPYNMFPRTYHVECVSVLSRKN